MSVNGTFALDTFIMILLSLLLVSMLASSVPLPLIFRNGVEKGRIAYYGMIGIVCAIGFLFSRVFSTQMFRGISSRIVFAVLTAVVSGIYALSWYLSIVFYQKREL